MASWGRPSANSPYERNVYMGEALVGVLRRGAVKPEVDVEVDSPRVQLKNRTYKRSITMPTCLPGPQDDVLSGDDNVRDWLTDVEKELLGAARPQSLGPRALAFEDDDMATDMLLMQPTDFAHVHRKPERPRKVIRTISDDLMKHMRNGWLEVNLSPLNLEELRAFSKHLEKGHKLYCLKLKASDCHTHIKLLKVSKVAAVEAQMARNQVGKMLRSPEVQSNFAMALGSVLEHSHSLNIFELSVNPGPKIMRSIAKGLECNRTLRCVSFKDAGLGDELLMQLSNGLLCNTSLQVLLLQGNKLTNASLHWINLMFKQHAVESVGKKWEQMLRNDHPSPPAGPSPRQNPPSSETYPLVGLLKLDLSDNRLTHEGIEALSHTLRMMENRLSYLGLRHNNLGQSSAVMLRELMRDHSFLQVIDFRNNRIRSLDVFTAEQFRSTPCIPTKLRTGAPGRPRGTVTWSKSDVADPTWDKQKIAGGEWPAPVPPLNLAKAKANPKIKRRPTSAKTMLIMPEEAPAGTEERTLDQGVPEPTEASTVDRSEAPVVHHIPVSPVSNRDNITVQQARVKTKTEARESAAKSVKKKQKEKQDEPPLEVDSPKVMVSNILKQLKTQAGHATLDSEISDLASALQKLEKVVDHMENPRPGIRGSTKAKVKSKASSRPRSAPQPVADQRSTRTRVRQSLPQDHEVSETSLPSTTKKKTKKSAIRAISAVQSTVEAQLEQMFELH